MRPAAVTHHNDPGIHRLLGQPCAEPRGDQGVALALRDLVVPFIRLARPPDLGELLWQVGLQLALPYAEAMLHEARLLGDSGRIVAEGVGDQPGRLSGPADRAADHAKAAGFVTKQQPQRAAHSDCLSDAAGRQSRIQLALQAPLPIPLSLAVAQEINHRWSPRGAADRSNSN